MQQVRDVMSSNVRTINPETPVPEVARLMRDEDIGAVPADQAPSRPGTRLIYM